MIMTASGRLSIKATEPAQDILDQEQSEAIPGLGSLSRQLHCVNMTLGSIFSIFPLKAIKSLPLILKLMLPLILRLITFLHDLGGSCSKNLFG